jgi:hypothetical protein
VRAEGKLDERTRMINVIVKVEKPYEHKPPLVVGLFVNVDIEGLMLDDVALIPRSVIHDGDLVWLADNDRLRFRKIGIATYRGNQAVVDQGLADGDLVITTPIETATDGMKIRIIEETEGIPS